MALEVEALLQPISDEAPCGEDLEYDPAFAEMVRASEGRPEQQMGEAVVEAVEADWRTVRDHAQELCGRTKDLRVGVYLARALCHTDGMLGLNDGLAFLRGLLERYWEQVHPQLDPEDNNDPTMRVNTLIALTDKGAFLDGIRLAPLVSSRAVGRLSLRDHEVATGASPAPEGEESPPDSAVIDAAFLDADLDELQATATAIEQAQEHAETIESVLTEKVGVGQAPDLAALPAQIKACRNLVSGQLARRGVGEGAPLEGGEGGVAGEAPVAAAPPGEVRSREDVIRVLDKACEYFERNEPSSPVPLLLRRAKRLVSKDFMEILRDMAPDGVQQAETIGGSEGEA